MPDEILIDNQDRHLITRHKWRVNKNGYVVRATKSAGKCRMRYLHREVMKPATGQVVDHLNGNRLDNRRANLRIVTQAVNAQNRRGANKNSQVQLRGVTYRKRLSKWEANGCIDGKSKYLGIFDTPEAAYAVAQTWRMNNMPGTFN